MFSKTKLEPEMYVKSAAVLKLARRALRDGADGPFSEALERVERLYREGLLATEDMEEGVQAFRVAHRTFRDARGAVGLENTWK